jgi:hypothetical protein
MKKILLSLTAIMMLAFNLNAQEQGDGSYLSFGSDTTLLIHPMLLGLSYRINVDAHFEHRYDSWTIDFEAPEGMRYSGYDRSSGMDVPYLRSDGSNDVYAAVLTNNTGGNVYSSTITEYGYWDSDSDGIYETYGIVKWEPGDYDSMLKLRFEIDDDFRQGHIVLSGEVLQPVMHEATQGLASLRRPILSRWATVEEILMAAEQWTSMMYQF